MNLDTAWIRQYRNVSFLILCNGSDTQASVVILTKIR